MDITVIVLLLAAVFAISIIMVVASQMREKARIERSRKLTALEDSYKKANRLLSELPGQYLTTDLKLLLISQIEKTCSQMVALQSDRPVKEWQAAAEQLRKKVIDKSDQRPPVKIDSQEKSSEVQNLLQSLFKTIEQMHKAGQIDAPTAKKNLTFVLFLVHKTNADLHVFMARNHVKNNEFRKAINAYHLASTEMGRSKDNPVAAKTVKIFRMRIKELEAAERDENRKSATASQPQRDREWNSFLHDDEWRKKADYDD